MPVVTLEILFRGFIKKFEYIKLLTIIIIIIIIIIHEVLQFSSTSIQILNYEYLLPMWVGMSLQLFYFVKFI